MIGFMANNLFPAHLGELVRAYVIGKKASISKSASLATIVIERILDGFAVLTLLTLVLAFSPVPLSPWMRRGVILVLVFYTVVLVILWVLAYHTKNALAWIHALSRFAPKLQIKMESLFQSFVLGLEILRDRKRLGITAALSFCVWIPAGLVVYCIFSASDIRLSIWVAFFLLAWLCIGVMVPSAPGYLGTVQFVCVACLALYGVDRSRALSISILYHVSQYIPVTIVGLVYAMKEGVSFSQIKQSSKSFEIRKPEG
jgi:glycosyltransferase 2 family protein